MHGGHIVSPTSYDDMPMVQEHPIGADRAALACPLRPVLAPGTQHGWMTWQRFFT